MAGSLMAGAPGVKLRDVEGTGTGNVVSLRRRADYRFYLLDERRSESRPGLDCSPF